jgi:long-chain alkane monooxygenase
MARELRLNAFAMNCVGHMAPGLWRYPGDQSERYTDLEHWAQIARLLEQGRFDGLFLADVLGPYDVYQGSADPAIRQGVQVPVNDPLFLVPAMAQVTKHLGFGVTSSLTYEHPYSFARRASTLDHLTKGRFGWNIVSSYLDSAARNFGFRQQTEHDERYDYADEYMEVCYKLWEQSWETDAVRRDRQKGFFADPGKVHPIGHSGKHFKVPGFHICEPSPQRTPVLYQAGSSRRGQQFAARHAECVFVGAPSTFIVGKYVRNLRRQLVEAGRNERDVLVFALFTVVLAATQSEAEDKLARYRAYIDQEGALVLMSGWTGVDLSQYKLDQELRANSTDANQSALESFTVADPNRRWTIREIAEYVGIGGRGPVIAGSPQTVADELQRWVELTDVDGFNLAYVVLPDTYQDIVTWLIPELQRRGVYKREYVPGTLRQKLFGLGPYLPDNHVARRIKPTGE